MRRTTSPERGGGAPRARSRRSAPPRTYRIRDFGDYGALDRAVRRTTRFIFSESPTNPYLNIFDLRKLADIARRRRVLTVIDSTFATPVFGDLGNQRVMYAGTGCGNIVCINVRTGEPVFFEDTCEGRTFSTAVHPVPDPYQVTVPLFLIQ